MTYSLGSVTFADGEVIEVRSNLKAGITTIPMPFKESTDTLVYNYEGVTREVMIRGQLWGASDAAMAARANTIEALLTAEQSSVKLIWPLKTSGIYVKIIDITFDTRKDPAPSSYTEFMINCVESSQD